MSPVSHHYREPSHVKRRYWGMLAFVAVLAIAASVFVSLSAGIHTVHDEAFQVVPRKTYVHANNPISLVERGLPPNSSQAHPLPATPTSRVIVVSQNRITLLAAGKTIRVINLASSPTDLTQIMNALNDKAWMHEITSGKILLMAALVTQNVNLVIGSPLVSEVQLADNPSVFIGADGGTLTFNHVAVGTVPGDTLIGSSYRPFVMATGKTTMNTVDSQFVGLGWDWNASYGVSWVDGATGHSTGSTFNDGFIGVYTSHVANLAFKDDLFKGNALYGLDPHTYSTGLTIDHVTAENNKAHGVIFSDHVTNSTIINSISKDNGENGIMMDADSTNNRIDNNTISDNTGDGLVTAASPHNNFTGNAVSNNRIGIRISPSDNATTVFTDNRVTSNGLASQGATASGSNVVADNGGQWNWPIVWWTWGIFIILMVSFALLLATRTRRNNTSTTATTM